MTTPPRRRPTSANPTSRPRRLAGRPDGLPFEQPPEQEPGPEPPVDHDLPPASGTPKQAEPEPEPPPEPEPDVEKETGLDHAEPTGAPGVVASRRTTMVLLGVIVVLALVSLAGGAYLVLGDDDDRAADEGSSATSILQISAEDAQVAAAAAGQAAYTIIATSWQDYDAQVDEAATLMTTTFAEEYRQTAGDVKDKLVANKTEVQVTVISQGVVSATETEVRALVFLNQFVTKNGKNPVLTPYRALVTVVNSDDGWLVADIETK